jgi:hypothetical protein
MEFTFIKGQRGGECLVYKGHKYTIYKIGHVYITWRCCERHCHSKTTMELTRYTNFSEIVHECTIKKNIMTKYKFEENMNEAAISGADNFDAVLAHNTLFLTRSNIASLGTYTSSEISLKKEKKIQIIIQAMNLMI